MDIEAEISERLAGLPELRSVEICGLRWTFESGRGLWSLPPFLPPSGDYSRGDDEWESWDI